MLKHTERLKEVTVLVSYSLVSEHVGGQSLDTGEGRHLVSQTSCLTGCNSPLTSYKHPLNTPKAKHTISSSLLPTALNLLFFSFLHLTPQPQQPPCQWIFSSLLRPPQLHPSPGGPGTIAFAPKCL